MVNRCFQLEKLLKDERAKNSQLYMKSMEVVRKYNQEIKVLKNKESENAQQSVSTNTATTKSSTYNNPVLISTHTQTVADDANTSKPESNNDSNSISMYKQILLNIKQILNINKSDTNTANSEIVAVSNSLNLSSLLGDIELLAKTQNKNMNSLKFDQKSFKDQLAKLNNEITLLKESKSKLETLYKIKCKSDLNKSAQIKKLEINNEMELLKLRNEFNYDLVGYLRNRLTHKDALLVENFYQLNNLLELVKKSAPSEFLTESKTNETTSSTHKHGELTQIKTFLENLINRNLDESNQADMIVINSLTNDSLSLNLNNIYKKPLVNLVYNSSMDKKAAKSKNSESAMNTLTWVSHLSWTWVNFWELKEGIYSIFKKYI